jgi:hypothetical protein
MKGSTSVHDWERRVRQVTLELQRLTGGAARQVLLDALEYRLAVLTGPMTTAERTQAAVARLSAAPGVRARRAPTVAEHARALGYGKEGV